jgi:hypothetical protein
VASSGEASIERQQTAKPKAFGSKRKLLTVSISAALVVAGTALVWDQYFRYWTIEDVAAAVSGSPTAPDFKRSLANKTVTVKGAVTNITSSPTTLGILHLVELDDFDGLHLVYWDHIPFAVGDRIRADVSFEWSCYNEEQHVYSPQADFPVIGHALGIATYQMAFSAIANVIWSAQSVDGDIEIEFLWMPFEVPLSDCNCTLRAGLQSWVMEYLDVMDPEGYGRVICQTEALSSLNIGNGLVEYFDNDGDGNFSIGDTVTLRDLECPDCSSGVMCYMVELGLDSLTNGIGGRDCLPIYLPLMEQGVYLPTLDSSHYAFLEVSEIGIGFRVDVLYTLGNVPWPSTSAILYCDLNLTDSVPSDWVKVLPFAESLDGGNESSWSSNPIMIGEMIWTVNVTDVDCDGILSVGDHVVIWTGQPQLMKDIDFLQFILMSLPTSQEIDKVSLIDSFED